MFTLTEIIAAIALVCSIVGTIVAIVNLRKHPKTRFFLLVILLGSVLAVLWIATNGFSSASAQHIKELQQKAREDAKKFREVKQKEEDQKIYEAALKEEIALQDAKKAILGTWRCSNLEKLTFHSDGPVSNALIANVYTYQFVDSTHLQITGFLGLWLTSNYDVTLTGPDQQLRWNHVICHRESK